jgi:hypothetical protein
MRLIAFITHSADIRQTLVHITLDNRQKLTATQRPD